MSSDFSIENDQRTTNIDNANTITTDTLISTNISSPSGLPLDVGFGQSIANFNVGIPSPDFGAAPAFTLSGTSIVITEGDWKVTCDVTIRAQTAAAVAQRAAYNMGFSSNGSQIPFVGLPQLLSFSHQVDNPPAAGTMEIKTPHSMKAQLRVPAGQTRTIDVWGWLLIDNEVPVVDFAERMIVAEKLREASGIVAVL